MTLSDAIIDLVNAAPLKAVHKLEFLISKQSRIDIHNEIGLLLCCAVTERMDAPSYSDSEMEFYNKRKVL